MAAEGADGPVDIDVAVDIDVDIADGRTRVTVVGDREIAVVVRSASGERIYLPPEREQREHEGPYAGDSPYEGVRSSPYQSPYDGTGVDESPYTSRASSPSLGVTHTDDGVRILHPEPVSDIRVLRAPDA